MTIIKIFSEIENEKVQKTLFKIGYEWNQIGCSIREFDIYPVFLYLDYFCEKEICWSFDGNKNIVPISAKHFLWKCEKAKKGKLKI